MQLSRFSPEQSAFILDRARVMKNEVLAAIALAQPFYTGGKAPTLEDITGFGPLHDYCDANCLGGWCDDDGHIAETRDRLFHEGEEFGWMDAASEAQQIVHEWITSGGMKADEEFIHIGHDEQIECLLDASRVWEAHGMVDDLQHRVGIGSDAAARLRSFLPEKPLWLQEFPSFNDANPSDMVSIRIPHDWKDTSWHNDVCPSFQKEVGDTVYRLWLDYLDESMRELPHTDGRFLLERATKEVAEAHSEGWTTLLHTDDWATVLDALDKCGTPEEYVDGQPTERIDTAESLLREVVEVYNLCDPDSAQHDPATDLITELSAVKERIDAFLARVEADRAAIDAAFDVGLDLSDRIQIAESARGA